MSQAVLTEYVIEPQYQDKINKHKKVNLAVCPCVFVIKHKMLTYKLQTSSKTTYSEQGQEKFDLSLSIGLVYVVTRP